MIDMLHGRTFRSRALRLAHAWPEASSQGALLQRLRDHVHRIGQVVTANQRTALEE
jgi:hypothetical protein